MNITDLFSDDLADAGKRLWDRRRRKIAESKKQNIVEGVDERYLTLALMDRIEDDHPELVNRLGNDTVMDAVIDVAEELAERGNVDISRLDSYVTHVVRKLEGNLDEGAMSDLDQDMQDIQWDEIVGAVQLAVKTNQDAADMIREMSQNDGVSTKKIYDQLIAHGFTSIDDLAQHIKEYGGKYVTPKDFDIDESTDNSKSVHEDWWQDLCSAVENSRKNKNPRRYLEHWLDQNKADRLLIKKFVLDHGFRSLDDLIQRYKPDAQKLDQIDLEETIRKVKGDKYRLYSKKGKNLGTFDSRSAAEKHEREVQYFKHANESTVTDKDITEYLKEMREAGYGV